MASSCAPIEVPADVSLFDFLRTRSKWAEMGDQPALVDGISGATVTYGELESRIVGAAHALRSRGFEQGDVLSIHMPNCPEYVIAFLATAALGGTSTTSNPLYTAAELAKQLEDSSAKYVVTSEDFRDVAEEAISSAGLPVDAMMLIGEPGCFVNAPPSAEPVQLVRPVAPMSDLCTLPYSSGTTGKPKGVMLSHYNLVANTLQSTQDPSVNLFLSPADKLVVVLPLYHIYGMTVLMSCALLQGSTLVLLPKFDPVGFLETIQTHRITKAFIVPPIAVFLAKHPLAKQYDLSSIDTFFSGAAPLDGATIASLQQSFGAMVTQGYGMTETSPIVCMKGTVPGAAGRLVPNMDAMLIDPESGKGPLAQGLEGELCVSGPNVMLGYLGRDDATTEVMRPDGFLRTGDMARFDDDGNIWIGDRLKEFIKVKGFQVAPAELEGLLLSIDAVADACVIGLPDDRTGEAPRAYVVPQPGASLTETDVLEVLKPQVAPYKMPREVVFIEAIPKSPSGKMLRRMLRESALKGDSS